MRNQEGHNKVYIATSLDGYIADSKGKIDFLDIFPIPEGDDMGYYSFIGEVDAILMGRKSFETVVGFGIAWPYTKPVFVWSHTLRSLPKELHGHVTLVQGSTREVLHTLHQGGFRELYIDGGQVIQSFLKEDLIDELTLTTIPVLLGSGIPLFGETDQLLKFRCVHARHYENGLAQHRYLRVREG